MQQQSISPTLAVVAASMFVSLVVLYYLWQKHAAGSYLLAYEPRKRVPWGPVVALLAITMPTALVMLLSDNSMSATEDLTPADFIYFGWLQSLANLGIVVLGMASLATFLQADRQDLGLPRGWRQAASDCWLGSLAMLASLLPIYAVQLSLTVALESKEQHPLIEHLQDSYSPQMVFVGLGLAVVVAPVYEEFTFRLLLQGWLEKWEDKLVGYLATSRRALAGTQRAEVAQEDPPLVNSRPAHGMIAELPHGWTPVLASGALFGLAHFGHGVAPVPLTLFGIVLGYLYQRTHRLLPCIVAHMAFNAYSMGLLGLQLSEPSV